MLIFNMFAPHSASDKEPLGYLSKGAIKMKIYSREVGHIGTNCYVVVNEKDGECFVVDPGGDCDVIMKMAADAKAKITAILLTHGHSDHIGALDELRKATGAAVYMSEGDAECLTSPTTNLSAFWGMNMTSAPAENYVEDGEAIFVAGMELKCLATPGHTKGGVCYYSKEFGVAFVGDTIFCESIGRTDFPGGSYSGLLDSIKSKLLTLDDDVTLLPGHGPKTTVGWERRRNPFLQ